MANWFDNTSLLWATQATKKDSVPQTETAEKSVGTVPLVETETPSTQAKLDAQGNVPLVSSPVKSENMGLGIEKTTKEVAKTKEKETESTSAKESVDDRLTRYYKDKYTKASAEEKKEYLEKYMKGHYATLKKLPPLLRNKLQRADITKLLANTKDGDSYQMATEALHVLDKENQLLIAKKATVGQSSAKLRARGEIGIANTIQKFDDGNQTELTQLVVDSKNEKAIKLGATHASELADQNQAKAVEIYEKADIKDSAKKELDKTLIDQYGKYAKSQEVDIHKTMSQSKFSETVEYAASNIYKFDKDNQATAVKITAQTGNEKAINAAAAQYAKYDKSAQSEIKSTIYGTGSKSAQTTLAKAETTKSTSTTSTTSTTSEAKTISNQTSTSSKTSSSTNTTISEQIKALNGSPNSDAEIKKLIAQASDTDKINLLKSLSSTELVSVINSILASSPSASVLSQVKDVLPQIDPQNRTVILKKISDICSSELIYGDLGSFDASSQLFLAQQGVKNGKSRLINENLLSNPVRAEYKRLLKENIE